MLLPHEIFGLLSETQPEKFNNLFLNNGAFWDHAFRLKETWLREHPHMDRIRKDFDKASPFKIFGDDTGISKNCERPINVLHWYGDNCILPFVLNSSESLAKSFHNYCLFVFENRETIVSVLLCL